MTRTASAAQYQAIVRMYEAQNIARNLFDNVGVSQLGRQQRHIALKFGAHGLKALDLKFQKG